MDTSRIRSPKVLIVRNDKLGDFMLSWPSFRLLKEHLPDATLTAMVRAYTREAAEMCPWVDDVLIDPGSESGRHALVQALRARQFDAVITLFSTTRIGYACWRAGIPYRLAPATKVAQFFYNRRLVQRRSRSEHPEWVYNLQLVQRYLNDCGVGNLTAPAAPYLNFPHAELTELRSRIIHEHAIDPNARLVFVHPGSGGSAVNLDLAGYAALLQQLRSEHPIAYMITAGPGEQPRAADLATRLTPAKSVVLAPTGLREFARLIACADLWISGSTGPLHIAGALDVPTAAFYPRHRSATALRWQTLNSPERRLAFSPPENADERAMDAIDLAVAAAEISRRFLR
ncbi:MAG: glycosyltransferase family 9 protein [Thiohalomonadaceae bacterium]